MEGLGGVPASQSQQPAPPPARILEGRDVNNQKAAGGVLITLENPSKPMRTEAADAGRYTSKMWQKARRWAESVVQ
jgi:hypothetical protein